MVSSTCYGVIDMALKIENKDKIIEILNQVLADEVLLYQKLRNYHWNVKGPNFLSLHELMEKDYDAIAEIADKVAERVAGYGGEAIGNMAEILEAARLEETPETPDAEGMISELVLDNETMAHNLKLDLEMCAEYGDPGAEDLLTGIMQDHIDMAWMLRSFLE